MSERRARRRIGWTVIDQALSSVTNFGLGILVARALDRSEFGGFALVFASYLFIVGLSRAICSEPLLVRHSSHDDRERGHAIARSTGAALALASVLGLCGLALTPLVPSSARTPLIALSVTLPGLLVQDACRYAYFAAARPAAAAANDGLWAVTQLMLLATLLVTGHGSVALFVLAWGMAATLCAFVAVVHVGIRPRPLAARDWLRLHRDLVPRFSGEFVAVGGAIQMCLWAVGAIGGVVAAGALRAGQLLLGPLTVLLGAAPAAAIPEGVRLSHRSPADLVRALARVSIVLCTTALGWGAVLLVVPETAGRAVLGVNWVAARPLIAPLLVGTAAAGAATGAIVGLRVLAAAERSFHVRLVVTPTTLAFAIAGVALDGARGAAIGIAVAAWIGAWAWWRAFHVALAERTTTMMLDPTEVEAPDPDEFAPYAAGGA
jgi:O-antigen/teichoic acid export membrane protein